MLENPTELEEKKEEQEKMNDDNLCPVCGSSYLIIEGRCTTCQECGWSKCSI